MVDKSSEKLFDLDLHWFKSVKNCLIIILVKSGKNFLIIILVSKLV